MVWAIAIRELLIGLKDTLIVLGGSLTLGVFLGIFLAVAEVYGSKLVAYFAYTFERIVRATPALVILFLLYYGVTLTASIDMPPLLIAILGLGARTGSYQSQIFRGAIQAVGEGQLSAARSLGMSKLQTVFNITLPQALRYAIGPWTNQYVIAVKATSYAYIVGVSEILRRGKIIISYTYGNSMIIFFVIAVIYFIISRGGNMIFYRLEEKFRIPGFERRIG